MGQSCDPPWEFRICGFWARNQTDSDPDSAALWANLQRGAERRPLASMFVEDELFALCHWVFI